MRTNVLHPDSILGLSSQQALKRLADIYCIQHALNYDHLEFIPDAINSKVLVNSIDLTNSGIEGDYIGQNYFDYDKIDAASLLPKSILFIGNLNQSFGQLQLEFEQYTGIKIEINESTWSDGINSFTPSNESAHNNLQPNASNQFNLQITFNENSFRFQNGSSITVRCINTQDLLNISVLKPEIAVWGSIDIYKQISLENFTNYRVFREISETANAHPYSVWELERNIISISNNEVPFEIYHLATGIRLDPEFLDVIVLLNATNGTVRVELLPNSKPNNPYGSSLIFDFYRSLLRHYEIETFYLRTMDVMPFEYLKDYLWSRHRFMLESGDLQLTIGTDEYLLTTGALIPLNGFTGLAKLEYPANSSTLKFKRKGEYMAVYFDIHFVE